MQVSLTKISNSNGVITDYESPTDEILVWFGIGQYFVFTYMNDFLPGMEYAFDPSYISMPCFHDDIIYIDLKERDRWVNEKSRITLACKNF